MDELPGAWWPRYPLGMLDGAAIHHLEFQSPYDWDAIASFLSARATPGVEHVEPRRYRRTITIGGHVGAIDVRHEGTRTSLALRVHVDGGAMLPAIVGRVRALFDLDAAPALIGRRFARDPVLAAAWRSHPGIRAPGAWDPFELAVRAIVGQQVSVRAATTLAGRMADTFGSPVVLDATLSRLFPTPAQLTDAPLERLGVMPARAAAIRGLARAVTEGAVKLESERPGEPRGDLVGALQQLPGIGPWTAAYIAMRAYRDADALPTGDLVLRQATGAATARELETLSQRWRPWRAYAVMLLWQRQASAGRTVTRPRRRVPAG